MMKLSPIIFLVFLSTLMVGASSPLSLKVDPQVGVAPLSITVRIHVPLNKINRGIGLIVDGDGYYSNSSITIDGENGPTTIVRRFERLPAGEYGVVAALAVDGPLGLVEATREQVQVLVGE